MTGAVTVGSLVVNLSANTGSLKTDMNDASSTVKSASQAIVNAWAGVSTETDKANAAGARLIAQLKEQITTFGMTDQELTQYKANLAGVGDEAQVLIARLRGMTDAQTAYAASADEASKHTESFSFASAGASRELIVLAHEMSQGNFSRFGGSMMVLAERTNAASLIMSAAGLTIGALVAVVAGAIAVYVHWKNEIEALNNGLQATNNFAGVTRDSLASMAASIQTSATGGFSAANTALSGLAATGKFAGATLQSAGAAALVFGDLTGKSSDEVIQYFSGMTSGVANWAETANQSYHFLTAAQYEHIATLEKEGRAQEAMRVTLDLMHDSMQKQAKDVGVLSMIWQGWGMSIDYVSAGLKKIVVPTIGQEVQKAIADLGNMRKEAKLAEESWGAGPAIKADWDTKIAAQRQKIHDLITKSNSEEMAVAAKQTSDLSALRAIAAQKDLDQIKLSVRSQQQIRDDAAKKIRDDADAVNADAKLHGQALAMTTEEVNRLVAESNAKYADKVLKDDPRPQILANALAANKELLTSEMAKYSQLDAMADLYHRYGVTTDDAYYQQKKANALDEEKAQIAAYDKDLATLMDYDSRNLKEHAQTQGKIAKINSDKLIAIQKYNGQVALFDTEDKLRNDAAAQAGDAAAAKYIDGLNKQLEALKRLNDVREVSKVAVQNDIVDMQKLALLNLEMANSEPVSDTHTLAEVTANEKLIASLRAVLGINVQIGAELKRQETDASLVKMFQDATAAAKQMETDLTNSFGNIGTAIGQLGVLFVENGKAQHDIQTQYLRDMAAAETATNVADAQQQAIAKRQQADATLQVKSYADMAGAASNFFTKGSTGYKALEDVQKVFRLAEMAMTLETEAVKLTSIATTTAADTTATGVSVANSGVRASADGVAAFAKTMSSVPFPYNLAAGAVVVAALVAAGVAMSGGGGSSSMPDPNSAGQVQATQGTGTVLGDATKQSQSIANSITLLANNSNLMLPLTSQMATSLKNIENGIAGVTNIVAGNASGITTGTNFNVATGTTHPGQATGEVVGAAIGSLIGPLGTVIGGVLGGLVGKLWGSSSSSVTDSGLQIGGTVGQLSQGQGVSQYANVHTDSSSWFGLSHSSSDSTQTSAVSAAINQQFGLIFQGLQSTLQAVGTELGKSATDVGSAVSSFVIDTTKISLKGLTGTALTDAINAVISSAMDNVSHSVFPQLSAFQQVGEGYTQTVVRVATGIEQATVALQAFGIQAVDYTNIVNKQGDVGAEIVRQSIDGIETSAAGALTGVGKIISTLQGTASDLASMYTSLLAIRAQLSAVGQDGQNLSLSMISGAGSITTLGSSLNDYFTNYFSDTERAAAETAAVDKQMAALGVTIPTSLAGFRALVSGIDTSTDSGAKLYGQLIALSGAFATATNDTAAAVAATAQATATANQTLQSNVDAARTALTTAYNTEATSLNSVITSMKAFANTIATFRDSLLISSSSPLSPIDQYNIAKRQYESTLKSAEGGDTTAQGQLQTSATAFLNASKSFNASNTQYASDFNEVQKGLTQMADIASTAADTAQAQLNVLNVQVSGLITINNSVLTVAQGIAGLTNATAALAAATGQSTAAGGAGGMSSSEAAAVAFEQAHGENPNGDAASYYSDWSAAIAAQLNASGTLKAPVSAILAPPVQSRAGGGYSPAGMTLVGENGPELVNFDAPSHISTATETRKMLSSEDSTAELKAQTKELRATVSLLSTGMQAIVGRLDQSNEQLDGIKKKANLHAQNRQR